MFGRKLIAFEIFAELVDLMFLREHLTPDGLKRARALAGKLSEHNR